MAPRNSDIPPPFPRLGNPKTPVSARNGLDHDAFIGPSGLSVSGMHMDCTIVYVWRKAPCARPTSSAVTPGHLSPAEILV